MKDSQKRSIGKIKNIKDKRKIGRGFPQISQIQAKSKFTKIRSRSKICYLSQNPENLIRDSEYPSYSDLGNEEEKKNFALVEENSFSTKFSLKLHLLKTWSKLKIVSGDKITFFGRFLRNNKNNSVEGLIGIDYILNKSKFSEDFDITKNDCLISREFRQPPNNDINFLILNPTK